MLLSLFTPTFRRWALSSLLLCSCYGIPAPAAANNDPKLVNSSNGTSNVLRGIDVSRWQKEVDWSLVKDAEVSFAFVKATQGDFRTDPYFARNWEETKRHGIKRGAYHFFKPEAPVEDQINLFISTVTLEPGDLPPVLDVEVAAPGMSGEQLRQNIKAWLEAVTLYYGVKPIIYTGQNYYRRWLKGHFPEYHFWIARYSGVQPETYHTDSWMFWQFTDKGAVSGINSAVDINFFAGDWETLHKLCLPDQAVSAHEPSPLKQLKHMYPMQ